MQIGTRRKQLSRFARRCAATALLLLVLSVQSSYSEASNDSCIACTGWRRVLSLYSGHWDVVNLVDIQSNTSALTRHLEAVIMRGKPLQLNVFGVSGGVYCDTGWYFRGRGCESDGTYARDGMVVPAWDRFALDKRTRVFKRADVPSVSSVTWEAGQHGSTTLRPADVAVYNVGDSDRAYSQFTEHFTIQASETLHAVFVFGRVCDASSPIRWVCDRMPLTSSTLTLFLLVTQLNHIQCNDLRFRLVGGMDRVRADRFAGPSHRSAAAHAQEPNRTNRRPVSAGIALCSAHECATRLATGANARQDGSVRCAAAVCISVSTLPTAPRVV